MTNFCANLRDVRSCASDPGCAPAMHPLGVRESSAPRTAAARSRPAPTAGRGPLLILAALALAAGAAHRPAAAANYPVTPEQRDLADKTASSGVLLSELAPGAPASYTIKRGDTLWSIATLYLKSPWRWPELWGMNRTQIRNPHLIYPGQTLGLVKTADGRAQLVLGGAPSPAEPAAQAAAPVVAATAVPTVRLSPRARELGAEGTQAVPSVPNNLIEPFLSRPQVVASNDLDKYPRIVSTPQDRVYLGIGDTAFARGLSDARVENYNVLRPAQPLYDPQDVDRRHPIAYEALFLGTARVTRPGDVATLAITSSKLEIGVGDRLVPVDHQELINYVPHRMEKDITGSIISVYSGVQAVGAGNIVTLNRGRNDGLEIGHVVAVLRNGNEITDRTADNERVRLPDEYVGTAFVFRVFDSISYALLLSASGPIMVGDHIGQPDGGPAAPSPTAMSSH